MVVKRHSLSVAIELPAKSFTPFVIKAVYMVPAANTFVGLNVAVSRKAYLLDKIGVFGCTPKLLLRLISIYISYLVLFCHGSDPDAK